MSTMRSRALPALMAAVVAALVACVPRHDDPLGQKSSSVLGTILGEIVTNGAFTNLYVYPTPSTQTWEEHIASLRVNDPASFSRASIDGVMDRMMAPGWPSYFDPLYQYHCGLSTDCGINPPQFFGSGVVSQACVDAALADVHMPGGVLEWTTIRSLANCHLDGMDPSPQVNLIFSPDIPIGPIGPSSWPTADGPEMCGAGISRAWHGFGLNTPNYAALPTSDTCFADFQQFTQTMSHEVVEILTDPAGLGFGDFPTYTAEAADLCKPLPDGFTNVNGDGLGRYWSNSDDDCQPRLDAPTGSSSTWWLLGEGSPFLQRFTGNVHDLSLVVPVPRTMTDAVATQVSVVIKTGGDDLRGGTDNADVTLSFAGGSTLTTNVNRGHHWDNGQTHSAILTLPGGGVRVSDITGVTLSTHFGGGISGDNWNVDKVGLVVSFADGSPITTPPHPIVHSWLDASELPLVRFTGGVHDKRLTVPPTDVGRAVRSLDLIISTGNDDLRGGPNASDNCDVLLELASGAVITIPNVNQGLNWPNWSKRTVSIPVPAGLNGGDITAVTLHTAFGGGISGDNWNVERVQLTAGIDPAALLAISIAQPAASDYLHSANLTLGYGATDDGGPGLASVVATIDGATTVAGHTLASGDTLPLLTALSLGPHLFRVDATDAWGNRLSRSIAFNVIADPTSVAADVGQLVSSGLIEATQQSSLAGKLSAAEAARARGQCEVAENIYRAFMREVEAQSGRKIDPVAAAILIGDARYVIDHCP